MRQREWENGRMGEWEHETLNTQYPMSNVRAGGRVSNQPATINHQPSTRDASRGSALVAALWTLLILSMLVGSFAFDMHVEANIASYYRKRMKSQYLARAGVEWAKFILSKTGEVSKDEEQIVEEEMEAVITGAINISRGVAITGHKQELGEGSFTLSIIPEKARFNVNKMTDEDWEEMLDLCNIPEDVWGELIDCFHDWTDENDLHLLNGAESDDPFYTDAKYHVKNAALDTVSELQLIKGFNDTILFGGKSEDSRDEDIRGIIEFLTTWDDGKININTADKDTLLLVGMEEWVAEEIIEGRKGIDGEAGTRDDGFESVDEAVDLTGMDPALKDKLAVKDVKYVRVISEGEVNNVKSGIWCVLRVDEAEVSPVFWREELSK
ncbi:MAG: general secretion pathway protein GspK [Verrucomicrobia bacterium]|nr:general secretion pathway protein GspK [Verrucomicrobiota bacterium]